MAADDYLSPDPDQGFSADLDTPSASGNRPASGAKRATPGEVLSQGFQGAQNAGDFLGLDLEFAGSQDPNQYAGTPLDLVPPPGTYADDGSYPQGSVPEPAPLPDVDAVQDYAQAPSAFEFGEDLGSDEGAFAPAGEKTASKVPLFIGALLVAGLVGSGVFFGPDLYQRILGTPTEVAQSTAPTGKQPMPREQPSTPPVVGTNPTSSQPVVEPIAAPVDVAVGSETPEAVGSRPSSSAPRVKPAPLEPARGSESSSPPNVTGSALPSSVASSTSPTPPQMASFPDLNSKDYEWASEDQLELIWRGSEVPLEAMKGPAKTLMPRVGDVRVFTITGDIFEGRLYAMGQNRVWLDAKPGRIGLDGERVERIEVLPPAPAGQVASLDGDDIAGGKRVRVRVPGGMLYGRVLKSDGEDVILLPDGGGRVRVKAGDVQELGSSRAIVVGR